MVKRLGTTVALTIQMDHSRARCRAGETAQELRALSTLLEDAGSILRTPSWLKINCNYSARESNAFLASLGTRYVCDTQTYTQLKHI